MRAEGLLLADMHSLKLAQKDLTTGSSTLLPIQLLTKAEPYIENPELFDQLEDPMELFGKRNRTVVSNAQLTALLQHLEQLIRTMGEKIHQGHIPIRPCRLRQFTGCNYCEYQAICQIETMDFQQNSEELQPLSSEELWERLGKGGREYAGVDN